ncbi:DNA methyltransferase [Microbacterium sp. RU33B]|uniref:DNA methyltransferase n=1 Tax=Microbacterium sp. RU33B TaxID=1907390 RepID=UPI000966AF78|nr:DNA methyltransferase [Microbacterium sp. RU33B]SIT72421.1 site-specific DNA-methyltransferase (adenine-specific) [Microbacterium sp. RU33B]
MQTIGDAHIYRGDVMDAYAQWPTPAAIYSDGAYGVGGFPGDPRTPEGLGDWYRPHIEAWSRGASLATTLWFWNTEVGWANVHPVLIANGWSFEFLNTWNKGIGHVAGNVNGRTIRRFPVVTEVCAFYTRTPALPLTPGGDDVVHMKEWLLREWKRTGLPVYKANEAAGVKNAATRKYLDQGWLWYFPPAEVMEKFVAYANENGNPDGAPYFSLDGKRPVTATEWASLRSVWNHEHGVTNVWDRPALRSGERFKGSGIRSAPRTYNPSASSSTHLNQKPLDLSRRIIGASTSPGDVVWEPFGGLATGSVAAIELGRQAYVAEQVEHFADLAEERLSTVAPGLWGSELVVDGLDNVSGSPVSDAALGGVQVTN